MQRCLYILTLAGSEKMLENVLMVLECPEKVLEFLPEKHGNRGYCRGYNHSTGELTVLLSASTVQAARTICTVRNGSSLRGAWERIGRWYVVCLVCREIRLDLMQTKYTTTTPVTVPAIPVHLLPQTDPHTDLTHILAWPLTCLLTFWVMLSVSAPTKTVSCWTNNTVRWTNESLFCESVNGQLLVE